MACSSISASAPSRSTSLAGSRHRAPLIAERLDVFNGRMAKAAGMKYMVLTVKHHCGHALWPSATLRLHRRIAAEQDHVVKRFVQARRYYGLKPDLLSARLDSHHMPEMTPAEYGAVCPQRVKGF